MRLEQCLVISSASVHNVGLLGQSQAFLSSCFPEIQQSPEDKSLRVTSLLLETNQWWRGLSDPWSLVIDRCQVSECDSVPVAPSSGGSGCATHKRWARKALSKRIKSVSQNKQAEDRLLGDHISHLLHRDTWREVRHITRVANRKQSVQKLHFHKDLQHGGREEQTARRFRRSAARI